MSTGVKLFLIKEDGGFVLLENGGKIIIDEIFPGSGSGGSSKSVGVSLVKKQLGNKPVEKFTNKVKGKLLIITRGKIESKLTAPPTSNNVVVSQLCIKESFIAKSTLIFQESFSTESNIFRKESYYTNGSLGTNANAELITQIKLLRKEQNQVQLNIIKKEKIKKLKRQLQEVQAIPVNYEILDMPIIDVTLGSDEVKQGELLRITTDVNKQVSQLWMRILDKAGVIVQKAGLVKKDATGFQILVSTQQLDKGGYVIQVSSTNKFTPIGIAPFDVVSASPSIGLILPLMVATGLDQPDDPDEEEVLVIYRTMMDSIVDAQCKQWQNKQYNLKSKSRPEIPQHFNCRCFYEIK